MVILCGKVGQARPGLAAEIVREIRDAGREATILVTDEITPDSLLPYREDAFVSTACPRVAMDDQAKYPKPLLTATEIGIVLGLRSWDDYLFDAFRSVRSYGGWQMQSRDSEWIPKVPDRFGTNTNRGK